jgi:5-methylcytosine-specific restriction endonuclease McrA
MFDDPFSPKKQKKSISPFGNHLFGAPEPKKKRDTRRAFTRTQKNEILHQQNYKCAKCKNQLDLRATEFDHKKGWADGGKTVTVNGQALCANCHKIKTHKSRLKKTDVKPKKKDEDNSWFGGAGGLFG